MAGGEQGAHQSELKKEIGLVTLVALSAGGMIGSGIFAMPAVMGGVAGPALLVGILVAAIVTTFLAMPYAELGAAFPLTGGPYSLPRIGLGDQGGFIMGWGYFLYAFIGTGAIFQIFVVYIGYWVSGLSVDGTTLTWGGTVVALVALWLFTGINLLGVKFGGIFANITMLGRLLPLAIFLVWGLTRFTASNFEPFLPFGLTGVTIAVSLFFWSFTGFEAVVIPSEEVKRPERTIPWAMALTMIVTTVVYLLIAFTFVSMIDWRALGVSAGDWDAVSKLSVPMADVPKAAGLAGLVVIVVIGALFATGGSGADWVLFQGRIPFAMAKDNLFWGPMRRVHERFGTPFNSLIFASVLTSIILVLVKSFPSVALMASITALVPYSAAALTVPILRRTKPHAARPFKLPGATVVTGAGFVFASWLVYWATWPWTLVGGVLMLLGFPAFLLIREGRREWRRNTWIAVYIGGMIGVSLIGDPRFVTDNFLPLEPQGWVRLPWDLVAIAVFALLIFAWALAVNAGAGDAEAAASPALDPETVD